MSAAIASRHCGALLLAGCLSLLTACANLTVTKVTDANDASVKGVRYYLPKPYLQATPQADGTVTVDVVFLPDNSRTYAIDTSSYASSYTFQVARDEKGILTALEFKASTSAVGQQLAASVGNYAVQAYNIKAAGLVAVQTQVNTAQTALDTARAAAAAAEATLSSDQAHGAPAATLTSDYAAVAQAKARQQVAEQALQRAQSNSQAVATSVAASTAAATTAPTMGTAFGQTIWSAPTVYNLPDKFGPVLYAVNDNGSTVELIAVQAELPGAGVGSTGLQGGVFPKAQHTFETTSTALGPPSLFPTDQTVPLTAKQAVFFFDRPVKSPLTVGSSVTTDATPPQATGAVPKAAIDGKSVTIDITGLAAGKYLVTTKFSYLADSSGHVMSGTQQVKLTVIP